MKTLLIILASLLFFVTAKAQTIYVGQTSNTFYVIAPTSGCNGIWAIDRTLWPGCTMGCTYAAASPGGCLTTTFPGCDSIVGDTLFLKVCSLPCNIIASCSSGPGYCGTGTPSTSTGIEDINKNSIKVYPNPANESLQIDFKNISDYRIEIMNNLGQVLSAQTTRSEKMIIRTIQFDSGVYFVKVQNMVSHTSFYDKIVISH